MSRSWRSPRTKTQVHKDRRREMLDKVKEIEWRQEMWIDTEAFEEQEEEDTHEEVQ